MALEGGRAALARDHTAEVLVPVAGGATNTPCPGFHRIPFVALVALAERFEVGEIKRAGKGCWNSAIPGSDAMLTQEFVVERLNHVIKHALVALGKLHGTIPFNGDDDAGAIMFGGATLAAWNAKVKGEK